MHTTNSLPISDEGDGERERPPPGKLSSERFPTWKRTIALLKGRSHGCLQVTEEYRPNWKGGGGRYVGVGSLESLVTLGAAR
ncbi:hypothetical protein CEXT_813401 [Caerostris extrusa]|uniref:Uncharacterized protein n=1 Tax=Caerostris extrusa TaxID=172846 RepID=A0AAV4XHS4_CAEEX|nr:hypothetical protein CEXT_813401 [Caerostris extrusa]